MEVQIKIKEHSWLAKWAAWKLKSDNAAIVFGQTIYLHGVNRKEFLDDERWVRHEVTHVLQYRQYGFIGFLLRYLFGWMKKGYHNNRFEVEARTNESEGKTNSDCVFI